MYSYKLLSHPKIYLIEHLQKVYKWGMEIFEQNKLFLEDKEILSSILVGHDLGKSTLYFQQYITKEKSHGFIKNHGFLSAIMTYCILANKYGMDKALKAFIIVKRHHGNLYNFFDEVSLNQIEVLNTIDVLDKQLKSIDFQEVNVILDRFKLPNINCTEIKKVFINLFQDMEAVFYYEDELNKNMEEYFKIKYLYSILIYSDKFSLIMDNGIDKDKSIGINKFNIYMDNLPKHKSIINDKRNEARIGIENKIENLDDKIYTLTLPTGMGKTLNSLNFALKLRDKLYKEEGIYYNLIYSFPFTSIIDQTYQIFKDIFGDKTSEVLKHHYLAKVEYKNEENYFEIEKSKFLIETWDSKIIVTTFVKVLQCIFSNKNSELLKFNKFANSIIILDEVQNIPHKYWKIIRESFYVLSKALNIYFILMTATQPLIFKDRKELIENTKEYFDIFDRTRLNINLNEIGINEFVEEICPIINKSDKTMIVLNTVKSAQEVYKTIKEKSNKQILFLSASIIPEDRKERIEKIKTLDRYILVSTQVVEAGVDIDNDVVIRDIGPWDSIVQCAGRCNRNNRKELGEVYIYKLKREKYIFANIVYGRFLISKTEKILKGHEMIPEKDYFKYSNDYFEEIDKDKSDTCSDEIFEDILEFKFNDINNEFKLIDNNELYIMPVFIEKDEKAVRIWERYEGLFNIDDRFERMNKFLEIKEQFLLYVININVKKFPFMRDKFYGRIPKENLEYYYSTEYGFIPDNDETMFF
ncbi:CRISPR-associated helicase Cas3' [Schnuerera sp. xch1]|uniref:CRISPR-associated helicase Cas3' n=1 Tax=Schnuerera sp. xch1 TaxID=2874283 RepID=UPI001CBEA526|nr:CRISPR-associated helicase Cas3' [Schnuerera sp. xch1]MBZ2175793.1 CRISPR-associated helicase Cas3' [Schnuerera sp. xch1]